VRCTGDNADAKNKEHYIEGTITYNRDSEFALWGMIEKETSAIVYFTRL